MADILLATINAGGSYDNIKIYYSLSAGSDYHNVKVWADYVKTAGSINMSAKADAYLSVAGTATSDGQKAVSGGAQTFQDILGPKTVKVSHTSEKTIAISYKVYLLNGSYSPTAVSGSKNITLPALTEKCSAPTSVTVSPSIVKPGGTVTVAWSGAKGGTNNKITGYSVTLNGKTVSVSSTSASGSTTFTNLTSRGTTSYKASVITKGAAGASYYSSSETSSNSVKVNTLPTAPTFDKSNQYISSDEDGVTVKATVGTDKDEGQTCSLYTSSSSGGTKTKKSSPYSEKLNPSAGESKSLYAWTYDGLEYSSSASRTIYRNTKPTITPTFNLNILKEITIQEETFNLVNSFGISATVDAGKYGGTIDQYEINLYYTIEDESDTYNLTTSSLSQSSISYNLKEIFKNQPEDSLIFFTIGVKVHRSTNGDEWSEEIISEETYCYINEKPEIERFTIKESNVNNEATFNFLLNSNYIDISTYSFTFTGEGYSYTTEEYTYNQEISKTILLDDGMPRGREIAVTIKATNVWGNYNVSGQTTFERVSLPVPPNALQFSSYSPFQIFKDRESTETREATISDLGTIGYGDASYKLEYIYNGEKFWEKNIVITPPEQETNVENYVIWGSTEDIREFCTYIWNNYNQEYNAELSGQFRFAIIDGFGNQASINSNPIPIDLRVAPKFTGISQIRVKFSNGYYEIDSDTSNRQVAIPGEKVAFNFKFEDENGEKDNYTSVIAIKNGETLLQQQEAEASLNIDYSLEIEVPEVTEDTTLSFILYIKEGAGLTSEPIVSNIDVKTKTLPNIDLKIENGKFSWKNAADGWADTRRAYLENEELVYVYNKIPTNIVLYQEGENPKELDDPTVTEYQLEYGGTYYFDFTYQIGINEEKTFRTNTFVYNADQPLVSYRRGQLGINGLPHNGQILNINSTKEAKTIAINGEEIITIDEQDQNFLINIIIDGGSW